ncbi:hypothetical protein D3C86_1106940 [compost metagenome]
MIKGGASCVTPPALSKGCRAQLALALLSLALLAGLLDALAHLFGFTIIGGCSNAPGIGTIRFPTAECSRSDAVQIKHIPAVECSEFVARDVKPMNISVWRR